MKYSFTGAEIIYDIIIKEISTTVIKIRKNKKNVCNMRKKKFKTKKLYYNLTRQFIRQTTDVRHVITSFYCRFKKNDASGIKYQCDDNP